MAKEVVWADEELSALGTVMQQVVHSRRMSHKERLLLNACLQMGLTAPDFFAVRKICQLEDRFFTPALLSLLLCERIACNEGSTYLNLEPASLAARLRQMGIDERDTQAIIQKVPSWLSDASNLFARDTDAYKPFILNGSALYRHRFLVAEQQINQVIASLTQSPWRLWSDLTGAFEKITRKEPLGTRPFGDAMRRDLSLAEEQQLAALVAVCAPFTVISGGPGTGKTSIVVTILRLLAALGEPLDKIALTAPTGRAANRMDEALRKGLNTLAPADSEWFQQNLPQARTLHRLLDFRPGERRFRFNRENPLEYQWLIVDEASMIDLVMMENLLTAMAPGARLIILGDANQLPSVEAGAVFRDLSQKPDPLAANATPLQALAELGKKEPGIRSIHLQRSFRQKSDRGGQHVLHISKAVNRGDLDQLFEGGDLPLNIHRKGSALPWDGVCLVEPDSMNINTMVNQISARFLDPCRSGALDLCSSLSGNSLEPSDLARLEPLFTASEQIRILCLTHKTLFGVEKLNSMLGDRFIRNRDNLMAGLPFMITHNDHRRGLYNGDIGLVIETGAEQRHQHRFLAFRRNEGFRCEPFDSLNGLQPAFAMTVHKSQGSETDHVVLVLPEEANALCKREVIYTALTRARKSVLIYGWRQVLASSVKGVMERVTGLSG